MHHDAKRDGQHKTDDGRQTQTGCQRPPVQTGFPQGPDQQHHQPGSVQGQCPACALDEAECGCQHSQAAEEVEGTAAQSEQVRATKGQWQAENGQKNKAQNTHGVYPLSEK